MDYAPYDSSDTDDDLPPSHQNRMPKGNHIAGNGRPSVVGSVPYPPRMYGETDMEAQIRQLEQEAYCSVLRAFQAQSDDITWDKEDLITNLRKELRLSNEEHSELLGKVGEEDVVRRIRDWRTSGGHQASMIGSDQVVHDPVPSPSVSVSRKKPKLGGSLPSQSHGGPSPSFRPQVVVAGNQPSSSAAKRGPMSGSKGKKHRPSQILPADGPSVNRQYPPVGPSGRGGQFRNRVSSGGFSSEPTEAASLDPLIGRKVRTRWPDDNNFYEAVITDYRAAEGLHALVYDINTANETWEWVNLSEISSDDIQWEGEDPGIFRHGGYGPGHGLNRPVGQDGTVGTGRGRGMLKGSSLKGFPPSQNGMGKKGSDEIHLLHTDTLIKEVERVFSTNHLDPQEIEKAKKMLKEHEQALADAIAKLADVSDGESGGGGHF